MVDLIKGLKVTFLYQNPKEVYTEQYPLERPQVTERYRGATGRGKFKAVDVDRMMQKFLSKRNRG